MISRVRPIATASAVAALVATAADTAARGAPPLHPAETFEDHAIVERGLVLVRLDPKHGAPPGACDTLTAGDLVVTVGGAAARVATVEHVPRPDRHWLLLDISESAEGRRNEAQRSAQRYLHDVMTPREDAATVVTIDDDVVLAAGPSDDPAALAARVGEISEGGASALRDGLDTVLRQVAGDRHEQLVLYWTDGQDTESLTSLEDLMSTIDRTPHATVFPIVLQPRNTGDALRPPAGTFLFDVARASGGEVLGSSDPRWLDRVRGWLARRFAVSFAYPDSPGNGRIAVSLRARNCRATVLRDPFARPDPVAGTAPPVPAAWVRLHARHSKHDDAACSGDDGSSSWDWPLRSEDGAMAGCLLDLTRRPERAVAREVRVVAPEIAGLPESLADVIEKVLPPRDGPSPLLVSGDALLAERARIAASLFAERADYRDFALARLARMAESDLRAIERGFARDLPGGSDAEVAAVAKASRAGRRITEASRQPTDTDLARVLAAWLSDVPARSLFSEWEARLIDARIASGRDPSAESRWKAMLERLAPRDGGRVVAPLILIRDPARDLVGFDRIVLPQARGGTDRSDEAIPDRPLGLLVVDRIATRRGVASRLASGAYRAARVDEEPSPSVWSTGPGEPFRRAHVTIVLESKLGPARAVLDADVATHRDGETTLERFRPSVTGDPELAALLRPREAD